MCKSEHFISVNKLMALWAIKRLAAHVSLGVSVISWHHAQQTDSCSDKSAAGNGCVATIWSLQLQQPNSHSSGCYQLMEVSNYYCQYAVTRVWHPAHIIGMWVAVWPDNDPEVTCHHTAEQYQRSAQVNYSLQVQYFSTEWPLSWPTAEPLQRCLEMPFPKPFSTH